MRIIGTAAAALLAAGIMAGCAPDSGKVVDRQYDSFANCVWRDAKNGLCKAYSGAYEVKVSNGSDVGWVEVSTSEYKHCTVGASWPDCRSGKRPVGFGPAERTPR